MKKNHSDWFNKLKPNFSFRSQQELYKKFGNKISRSMVGTLASSIVSGKVGIYNYKGEDRYSLFKYIFAYESSFEKDQIKTIYEEFPSYKVLTSVEEIDDTFDFIIANLPINLQVSSYNNLLFKSIPYEWQIVYDMMKKMKEGSSIISSVHKTFFSKKGEKFRSALASINVHTTAAIHCSKSVIVGSLIKPEIVINKKGFKPESYFMASLNSSNAREIAKNYLSKSPLVNRGENEHSGVFTDIPNFKGR